jgi:hypothetical protein
MCQPGIHSRYGNRLSTWSLSVSLSVSPLARRPRPPAPCLSCAPCPACGKNSQLTPWRSRVTPRYALRLTHVLYETTNLADELTVWSAYSPWTDAYCKCHTTPGCAPPSELPTCPLSSVTPRQASGSALWHSLPVWRPWPPSHCFGSTSITVKLAPPSAIVCFRTGLTGCR